jgi:hypothetical protein
MVPQVPYSEGRMGDKETREALRQTLVRHFRPVNEGKPGVYTMDRSLYADGQIQTLNFNESWGEGEIRDALHQAQSAMLREYSTEAEQNLNRIQRGELAAHGEDPTAAFRRNVNRLQNALIATDADTGLARMMFRNMVNTQIGTLPASQQVWDIARQYPQLLAVQEAARALQRGDVEGFNTHAAQLDEALRVDILTEVRLAEILKASSYIAIRPHLELAQAEKRVREAREFSADNVSAAEAELATKQKQVAKYPGHVNATLTALIEHHPIQIDPWAFSTQMLYQYATPELSKAAISSAVERDPSSALINYHNYKDQPWAGEVLETAARLTAEREPRTALMHLDEYKDQPWAGEVLETAARNAAERDPGSALTYLNSYKHQPWAEQLVLRVAHDSPENVFQHFRYHHPYPSHPFAERMFFAAFDSIEQRVQLDTEARAEIYYKLTDSFSAWQSTEYATALNDRMFTLILDYPASRFRTVPSTLLSSNVPLSDAVTARVYARLAITEDSQTRQKIRDASPHVQTMMLQELHADPELDSDRIYTGVLEFITSLKGSDTLVTRLINENPKHMAFNFTLNNLHTRLSAENRQLFAHRLASIDPEALISSSYADIFDPIRQTAEFETSFELAVKNLRADDAFLYHRYFSDKPYASDVMREAALQSPESLIRHGRGIAEHYPWVMRDLTWAATREPHAALDMLGMGEPSSRHERSLRMYGYDETLAHALAQGIAHNNPAHAAGAALRHPGNPHATRLFSAAAVAAPGALVRYIQAPPVTHAEEVADQSATERTTETARQSPRMGERLRAGARMAAEHAGGGTGTALGAVGLANKVGEGGTLRSDLAAGAWIPQLC